MNSHRKKKIEAPLPRQYIKICGYTDFSRDLVEMARKNEPLLDGTEGPIKQLFDAGDIVIAVWDYDSNSFDAGSRTLKGKKLVREAVYSNRLYCVSVVPCRSFKQANAIEQNFGTREELTEPEPCRETHTLWPGVSQWTDMPEAAGNTRTATYWLSFATDGVAIVDGPVPACAVDLVRIASQLGCNPYLTAHNELTDHGAQRVAMQKLPPGLISKQFKNRLFSKDEIEHLPRRAAAEREHMRKMERHEVERMWERERMQRRREQDNYDPDSADDEALDQVLYQAMLDDIGR